MAFDFLKNPPGVSTQNPQDPARTTVIAPPPPAAPGGQTRPTAPSPARPAWTTAVNTALAGMSPEDRAAAVRAPTNTDTIAALRSGSPQEVLGIVKGLPATTRPNFADILAQQFGASGLFSDLPFTRDPIGTAEERAQHLLNQTLGNIQAQMGAAGLGRSARNDLLKGAAIGEAATGLGDVLAQRALQGRAADQQNLGNLLLGAGQQNLGEQQQAFNLLQFLGNLGGGVTNLGTAEQQIPGLEGFLNWLAQNVGSTSSTGGGRWTEGRRG